MHQRISVRAIVRKDGRTLLLKRANGRESILGKYELPGGMVRDDEQPDDAIRRIITADTGLAVQSLQLFDAITYTDRDNRTIQYAVIVYMVGLSAGGERLKLSDNYSKYVWQKMSNAHQELMTDVSQIILGIVNNSPTTGVIEEDTEQKDVSSSADSRTIIYSDGGSRGNPGPSAAGYVVLNSREEVIDQGGEYLGITTNNQAEYHGVRLGLEAALRLGHRRVDFRIDSMLVVNQLNHIYQIRNRELWPINERIISLVQQFDKVTFSHVKREFNQLADGMVNRILDEEARKSSV